MFPDSWIGTYALATTIAGYDPLNFSLWSFVKETLYRIPMANLADLEGRIDEAIVLVTSEMLSGD